ncbi:MAG TPA: hypothetical protein VN837_05580 [Chloroflexota bacterium]|nr:hypothetical protein [Chloroflexota bacterium]
MRGHATPCRHEGRKLIVSLSIETPEGMVLEERRACCVVCCVGLMDSFAAATREVRRRRELRSELGEYHTDAARIARELAGE